MSAVTSAITHPADTLASAVDFFSTVEAAGVGGVAGAIIGGIAGTFVMNPAYGAELGLHLGISGGAGLATVDPNDVKKALAAGNAALYDAAGNLLDGDPSGVPIQFVPKGSVATPLYARATALQTATDRAAVSQMAGREIIGRATALQAANAANDTQGFSGAPQEPNKVVLAAGFMGLLALIYFGVKRYI